MISKLVLGTAQFGLDYGIKNIKGKIAEKEISEILNYAYYQKIAILDTAYNYGNTEQIIGKLMKRNNYDFNIISKLPACNEKEVVIFFEKSIFNLKVNYLYGYLIHDMNHFFKNTKIWNKILQLKKQGKVKNIGFSIYTPDELKRIISEKFEFDIIQLPYNIFDQRFANSFKLLQQKRIKVFIRSVFLQGLLLINPEMLPDYFAKIRRKLILLQSLSKEQKIPLSAICLQFACLNPYINKVVIGIDSKKNLRDNINSFKFQVQVKKIYKNLLSFREDDEKIIVPTFWPKRKNE